MQQKIATHIISGFLGTGKTTFISSLVTNKPANETWVVLVNESGTRTYAKQQLANNAVIVKELYGGCLCCSAGMPFRVALNQLIKQHKPHRIFIEPAGAGHLQNIKKLLQGEFYQPILTLHKTLCLLSYAQLIDGKFTDNKLYLALLKEADKLCFYENEAEYLVKKMAAAHSKPLHKLLYQLEDLN